MNNKSIDNSFQGLSPEPQRRDPRDSLFLLARLKAEGAPGEAATVRVRNVSSGGLMAEASDDYRPGGRVEVTLDGIGLVKGTIAWAEAGRVGVAFDHPVDKSLARKGGAKKTAEEPVFRPLVSGDHRRPPLKPR